MILPEQLAGESEHSQQTALFCWIANNQSIYPKAMKAFAIPNGGERNEIVAARLKAEGVKTGVPDIFLPVPSAGYHGLFIEMKAAKYRTHNNGGASPQQLARMEALSRDGYYVAICYDWKEARDRIISYLTYPV